MVAKFAYDNAIKKGLTISETKPDHKAIQPTLKERKDAFYQQITKYKANNPDKYPYGFYENFFTYWTEPGRKKSKKRKGVEPDETIMRFEAQDFFDIGRRMATGWAIFDAAKQSEFWKRHKLMYPSQKQELF